VQLVDSSSVSFNVATSPLTLPLTGCAAGNLLILGVYNASGNVLAPVIGNDPGFNQFIATDLGGIIDSLDYYWYVCDGTETGNLTLTRTNLRAAMLLELELPSGFVIDQEGLNITGEAMDASSTTVASPTTLTVTAGSLVAGQELHAAIQIQTWFARESGTGNTVTFTGDVGGSVSAMSLEVTGYTSATLATGWRWRTDVRDLSGTVGTIGVDEVMTVSSSASVGGRQVTRAYLVDLNYAPVATVVDGSDPLKRRRYYVTARELPYEVRDRDFIGGILGP
jgi:hypothetical protein